MAEVSAYLVFRGDPFHGIHKDFLRGADGQPVIDHTAPGASASAVYRCNSSDSPAKI
jgi:hypothetical protein